MMNYDLKLNYLISSNYVHILINVTGSQVFKKFEVKKSYHILLGLDNVNMIKQVFLYKKATFEY